MAQAESEYKDFETFFPNMPEAAEAQLKIANIHYREMEKADRDYTHAKRAEEEYRQLILQYPDSKLVPEAKQRLMAVQEVLAEREYMIGHFYFQHESWPAAIARLKSCADTYPLYSGADQALYELGAAYQREIDLLRLSKLPEAAKGTMIKQYTDGAAAAYDRIVTRYPEGERVDDAKRQLQALKRPVPVPTPEAIAQNKAEIASRGSSSTFDKLMLNFKKGPDVSEAAKVGEPTMVDPKQASAPDMVRSFTTDVLGTLGKQSAAVQPVKGAAPPAENAPVPHSDASGGDTAGVEVLPVPGSNAVVGPATAPVGGPVNGAPASGNTKDAVPEMQNDLAPAGSPAPSPVPGTQPAVSSDQAQQAPAQVNDAAGTGTSPTAGGTAAASTTSGTATTAPAADPNSESTSKKKKKHHFPF
jgi:outer membrane protein assembly factor BamD